MIGASWQPRGATRGGDRVDAGVAIEVEGDRITAVTRGVASPPAGAVRLAGVTLPGLANAHSHAFHRALRGTTQSGPSGSKPSGPGASRCTRSPIASIPTGTSPSPGRRSPRWPWRASRWWASSTTCTTIATDGPTRSERDGRGDPRGGLRGRNTNHPARRLLPARRQRRRARGRAATLRRRRRRTLGRAGRRARSTRARRRGSAPRSTACGRSIRPRPQPWPRGRPSAEAPLHAHVSEQPAENEACLAAHGRTPTGLLADAGAVHSRFTAVHATHVTADDISILGGARATCCLCPTTERDLADGVGPASSPARRGLAARARNRLARRHRPLRGGPGRRARRAARLGRARQHRRPSC